MYTSILNTLFLAGSALAIPTNTPRKESCLDVSQHLKLWKVAQFDYHSSEVFTTPAHQNSWGYVNFTLENPAVDYRPICSAASNQLSEFFFGTVIYDCKVEDDGAGGAATFTYSRPSGELRINQTWACTEEEALFEAEGGIDLDLTCEENKWQNPDWSQGQIYSTRNVDCNFVDAETPITTIRAVRRKE